MILDLAIGLSWVAAGYRIWVLVTHPRRLWRTAFSVSMVATTLAFSLYRIRQPLDAVLGQPNVTGLLSHLVFAVGGAYLLIYLDFLRLPDVSRRQVRTHLAVAAGVMLVMAGSWVAAPIHAQQLDDLLPLAGYQSVAVYCVGFWLYLVWALSAIAWTCLARGRTFRRADLARSVSLLLIGLSAFAAIPAVLLWSASIVVRHVSGAGGRTLNNLGDTLMPWPVLVNATGVLSLLTVPYLTALVSTWWRARQLRPLWEAMVRSHPQVHLELQPSGGPLTRLQTRLERAIIEIHDALRLALVDVTSERGPSVSLGRVAAALHTPSPGGLRAADLLERVETREADVRQVLALARAFRTSGPR